MIPYVLRRHFGLRAFGKIFGLCYGIYIIGPMFGPLLMASIYDHVGSYGPVLAAFACLSLAAAILILIGQARLTFLVPSHAHEA